MFKRQEPLKVSPAHYQFPHCDQRILHAPGECQYCDKHKDWQYIRQAWGIAFTGHTPENSELPCPADNARGNKHKNWPGNVAAAYPIQNNSIQFNSERADHRPISRESILNGIGMPGSDRDALDMD